MDAQAEINRREFYVVNSKTETPIENVHVKDKQSHIIAFTNEDGVFQLNPSKNYDTLKLTCIGYKSLFLDISNIENNILELLEDTTFLNDVIIYPDSPKELVLKCISNIEDHYLIHGPESRGKVDITTILKDSIDQNQFSLGIKVKKAGGYDLETVPQAKTRTAEGLASSLVAEAFYFDHIINKRGFLNINNVNSWRFSFDRETVYNNDTLVLVRAKYISGKNGTTSHTGVIYINENDFSIPKIEYHYEWFSRNLKKTQTDSLWHDTRKWSGYAYYGQVKHGYELINLKYELVKDIFIRDKRFFFRKIDEMRMKMNYNSEIK